LSDAFDFGFGFDFAFGFDLASYQGTPSDMPPQALKARRAASAAKVFAKESLRG